MLFGQLKFLNIRVQRITKKVVRCPFLNSAHRDSGSGGLEWSLGISVINKLPGDTAAGALDHALRNNSLEEASQNLMCVQVTWDLIKR